MPTLRVRFSAFEADLRTGELRKHGVKVKLHHQPFQVLSILLEQPGEVVTREELQRRLWPADTFVDFDNGLNSAVKKLRVALNDSAGSPRYVETLSRRGYRFIAPLSNVSTSEAEPAKDVSVPAIEEPPAEREREMPNPSSRVHSRSVRWAIAGVAATLLVLLVGLNTGDSRHLPRRQSVDPQAHEFYVKGNFFVNKRNRASILKGIDYYHQAIQRDPKHAAAYAAMARAYGLGYLSPEEQCSKQRALAGVALQLDGGLAEAHAALADRLFQCDWDWAGAEREYQRAIELNPSDALTHAAYGQLLKTLGRQNWVAETKRALELDPVSLTFAGGEWYLDSGQYDEYIERQRQKLELDPSRSGPYVSLGRVYTFKGMYEDAIANLQQAVDLSEGGPGPLSALGYTYGVFGKRKEALEILHQLTLSNAAPTEMALVYLGLGEKDRVFDYLQKAVADHSIRRSLRNAEWNSIHSDPRWAELLRRMGLPP
jgi:DNA-binding winged helix-turn-helix (wHTH) protein/tetratricopeptide (TPR) repeat protein